MRERKLRKLLSDGGIRKILSLVGCGVVAGVVVAAAALPAAAMTGALTTAGVDAFDSLPADFTTVPAPQSSFIYASDGKTLLAMLYDENRRDVPLSDVAPVMQQAIVASEDVRFYSHHGVDFKGVARALVADNGGDSQGASTLTMQYVRQSAIYSAKTPEEVVAASEKTKARKIREMKLAMALEEKLNKKQILERYLNIAPFGHGAWGIYAASHVYFGKDPKDLTLPEAALLAGLVQAPSSYDPADPAKLPAALKRREHVFDQMVRAHNITAQQAAEARKAPLQITDQHPSQGCVSVPYASLGAGFFCDYLYRWWLEQPAFGADAYERENRLRSGGYTIISSLDIGIQQAMKRNIDSKIKATDRRALMLSAVEPSTGRVLAMATNRNFSLDTSGNLPNPNRAISGPGSFPNTTNPLISGGGGVNGYQAGSTFKMFTMLAALEKGMPLSTTIDAPAVYHSHYPTKGTNCPGTQDWCPKNASASEAGTFNMWTGFGKSVNTFFVPLEERAGAENAVAVAQRLGIQFRAQSDQENAKGAHYWGPFTLGVSATTPLDLAGAYASLANDGAHCAPTPITEIRDANGKPLDVGKPQCTNGVSADVAHAAIDAARCPVGDHGGLNQCHDASTARGVAATVGKPVFGKTGTTDTNESATLVASTKQVTVAGIEADPDWQADASADHNHVDQSVAETLRDAMAGKPAIDFPQPSSRLAYGR
ncbi:glycosyl transferase [Planosporangium thailandense]|uniref:Glycosyl transferase n=2 Tax=Planosporangium thailandense TaxID=765197 RepID=A0ABX0XQU3_9ACTN|nr:glycosyl transferase [Planosporangium thailandense]